MLDENVPASVAEALRSQGHEAEFVRDHVPAGSPDPLVASISQDMGAVLISFDGDFQKIAPRVPDGQQKRFRRLSRIWLRCHEWQAAARLDSALSFVLSECELAERSGSGRAILQIGTSFLRTDR